MLIKVTSMRYSVKFCSYKFILSALRERNDLIPCCIGSAVDLMYDLK
jgi:hypothetical protein